MALSWVLQDASPPAAVSFNENSSSQQPTLCPDCQVPGGPAHQKSLVHQQSTTLLAHDKEMEERPTMHSLLQRVKEMIMI